MSWWIRVRQRFCDHLEIGLLPRWDGWDMVCEKCGKVVATKHWSET